MPIRGVILFITSPLRRYHIAVPPHQLVTRLRYEPSKKTRHPSSPTSASVNSLPTSPMGACKKKITSAIIFWSVVNKKCIACLRRSHLSAFTVYRAHMMRDLYSRDSILQILQLRPFKSICSYSISPAEIAVATITPSLFVRSVIQHFSC